MYTYVYNTKTYLKIECKFIHADGFTHTGGKHEHRDLVRKFKKLP